MLIAALGGASVYAPAQHGPGFGQGTKGMGLMGTGGGTATMSEWGEIHDMFIDHDKIRRTVTNLPNGIRIVTESDHPELAATIVSHTIGIRERVTEGRDPKPPIQSPTLQIILRNKDKIKTAREATAKGLVVVQTSSDPEMVAALQKHASEVSKLVRRGTTAADENMMCNGGTQGHGHQASTVNPSEGRDYLSR